MIPGAAESSRNCWAGCAAVEAGIPCTLSTAGTTSLEDYARFAPQNAWFQLYVSRFDEITNDIVDRTDRAGYEALVVTVDSVVPANRECEGDVPRGAYGRQQSVREVIAPTREDRSPPSAS